MAKQEAVKEVSHSDRVITERFKELLGEFKAITIGNPIPEKVKDSLTSLKTKIEEDNSLTARQKDALYSRCQNYLAGTYGVDAKKDAYNAPAL